MTTFSIAAEPVGLSVYTPARKPTLNIELESPSEVWEAVVALGAGAFEAVIESGDLSSAWAFFASLFASFFASFLALALEMDCEGRSASVAVEPGVEAVLPRGVLAAGDALDGINDAGETGGSAMSNYLRVVRLFAQRLQVWKSSVRGWTSGQPSIGNRGNLREFARSSYSPVSPLDTRNYRRYLRTDYKMTLFTFVSYVSSIR